MSGQAIVILGARAATALRGVFADSNKNPFRRAALDAADLHRLVDDAEKVAPLVVAQQAAELARQPILARFVFVFDALEG